jgi:surfeit locus 1 family protein
VTSPPPRRLLIPVLSTLAMLAVLLALGTWQVQRLFWKRAILQAVDAAESAPPTPLGAAPIPFARVIATGTFDPAITALYGTELRPAGGANIGGARALAILRRDGAAPLLVDRGWVPAGTGAPPPPPPPTGPATVTGYVRPAEPPGWFTPAPDPATSRFYALDPATIGPALGVPGLAPFTLVALGPAAPGQPEPARALPRPANNHLSYAITWYGLAVALLVVFAVYLRKVLRS